MSKSTKIAGFEIFELLGEGGMGAVFKARQTSLDRIVAIKILKPHLVENAADIARFQLEARAAAKLNHPGIVQVYDAGEDDGRYYFSMEYIEGRSLGDWLAQDGKISERDALAVVACVAEALASGWQKAKIIHRDIKPDNILIDTDGAVKVADLGLVKLGGRDEIFGMDSEEATLTPNYCSPEQAAFLDKVDFRSDIYSLGATLYHMLTGKMPFQELESPQAVRSQVSGILPDPRDIDPAISDGAAILVRKMMAKKPGERYSDWEQVGVDVGLVTTGHHPQKPLPETSLSTIAFKASKKVVLKEPGPAQKVVLKNSSRAQPAGGSRRVVVNKQELATAGAQLAARKKKKNPAGLLVAGLIAVGLGVGGYYVMQHPSASGGGASAAGNGLSTKLGEAKTFIEQHPEDFDGALARYEEAAALAAGTTYEAPVAAALKKLHQLRQQDMDGKMADLEAEVEALLADRKPDEARQRVQDYAGPYARETMEIRQVIAEDIRSRMDDFQKEDELALQEAQRRQALQAAEALLSPGLKEADAAFQEAWREARKDHRAKLDQAAPRYRSMLEMVEERARSTGELDLVLAVKKERERFAAEATLPERITGTPPALLKEALTRGAIMRLDVDSSLETRKTELVAQALAALEAEKKKLVAEDLIDQAVKVNEVMEHLKAKGNFPPLVPRDLGKPVKPPGAS